MPNQFLFEEGPFNVANDIEESFATDYWLFEQYIGDQLFSWGVNSSNQVDITTAVNRSTPRQEFTSSTNWKQVVVSFAVSAIKTDGTLWSWGSNTSGVLARNDIISRSTPVQEWTSSTNWKQVAGGYTHIAAIKTDGTLWVWGDNADGNIGDNTRGTLGANSRSTPRQEITSSTNWKQVACGVDHTAAIKTDGTLWCWGGNTFGELGDNTIANRSTPRQEITSSTNWKQVSCFMKGNLTAAIKTDGTLWAWGENARGQLGDNTIITRSTPRQEITSSTNWKQVGCGRQNITAIKTNGTLWTWGFNSYGQIGDNTIITRSTPVQEFTSSTNWKQVAYGEDHAAAIKTDGTLWTWGRGLTGQLGHNSGIARSTPRQEWTSSTNWKQVNCSSGTTSAIKTGINIDTGIPTN